MVRDARLSILTAQEVGDLYGLPRFTEDDRRLHFDLVRGNWIWSTTCTRSPWRFILSFSLDTSRLNGNSSSLSLKL
jgi:hypothetical protein